jgi:hypothetical protein
MRSYLWLLLLGCAPDGTRIQLDLVPALQIDKILWDLPTGGAALALTFERQPAAQCTSISRKS